MRWAVAGYGDVVVRRVLPALRAAGEVVVGVCGRTESHAAEVAGRFGIPVATTELAGLLDRVDAVYVATPVVSHVPLALAAVKAGRHVLIEKPVAGALHTEVAALGAVAAERRVTIGVAYYRRLAPALIRLREIVAAHRVRHIEINFRYWFDPAPTDPMHWRTERPVAGGGVLADVGSHRLDLLCWLFGRPATVEGELAHPFPGGSERTAHVRLGWPSGLTASAHFEWRAGPAADRLTIVVDGGRILLDPLDSGELRWEPRDASPVVESFPVTANPHLPLVADFASAVRKSGEPACALTDGSFVDSLIAAVSGS